MAVLLSSALMRVQKILEKSDIAALEQFALWCERRRLGERALKGQTVREYRTAAPKARLTPRAALHLYEFLGDCEIRSGMIKDADALKSVRNDIRNLVEQERATIYAEPLENDTTAELEIDAIRGAYALWRYETGDQGFQQELLLLHGERGKSRWATRATYVRPQIVYRGTFHVLEGVLSCTLGGYPVAPSPETPNGHPKANKLLVTRDGNDRTDILCGVLSGVATGALVALVMPIILIRIPLPPDMDAIAAHSDAHLAQAIAETNPVIDEGDPRYPIIQRVVDLFNEPLVKVRKDGRRITQAYRSIDSSYIDEIRPMLRDERARQHLLGDKFHAWLRRAGSRETQA
jgi:hypothetical protein